MKEDSTNSKAIEDAPLRAGDLVLCKLRNGYERHVLVLSVIPYQLWKEIQQVIDIGTKYFIDEV